jgi:hypothetical protein
MAKTTTATKKPARAPTSRTASTPIIAGMLPLSAAELKAPNLARTALAATAASIKIHIEAITEPTALKAFWSNLQGWCVRNLAACEGGNSGMSGASKAKHGVRTRGAAATA